MKFGAYVILFFSCFTFVLGFYNFCNAITHPVKYKNEIIFYAKQNQLAPALVASVINVESGFNPNSKSKKNAIGLMQIKLTTANYLCEIYGEKSIGENELFLVDINIKFGCRYLKYLMKKFSNLNTVLACYNAGETRVRTWLNSEYSNDGKTLNFIPFIETKNYILKVDKNIKFYEKIYKNQ